ncbi:hypothetical protein [Ornithobacterium rhinotracheale]|nr:hypothetical protein [Ornithobacterium rhinotracheale]
MTERYAVKEACQNGGKATMSLSKKSTAAMATTPKPITPTTP